MDSRPHDDFLPPERPLLDEASPASKTLPAGEAAPSSAAADAAQAGDLHAAIEDLEFELASLLDPDLETMGLDETGTDATGATRLETQGIDAVDSPDVTPGQSEADASNHLVAEAVAETETTEGRANVPLAMVAGDAEVVDAEMMLEDTELELALDEMVFDMVVAEAEAAATDDRPSLEAIAVHAETIVVTQIVADAAPDEMEIAALDETPLRAADDRIDDQATAIEPDARAPVAETSDMPLEERSTTVDAVAEAQPDAAADAPRAAEPEAPAMADMPIAVAAAPAPDREVQQPSAETDAAATDTKAARGGSDAVAAEAIVVSRPKSDESRDVTVTAPSFEEALCAQDMLATGFEAAVRSAAEQAAGRFLFQMPVHSVHDCQRVAAVNLAGDASPATVLVLLAADGRSFRLEDARASDNPFAGMAVSYGGLLAHLKSLPTRAAA